MHIPQDSSRTRRSKENAQDGTDKSHQAYEPERIDKHDSFGSEDGTPEVVSVLFQLVKQRDEKHLPTLIGSQYDPSEWSQLFCGAQLRKGEADSIRRRLTGSAYIVKISLEGKQAM